MRNAFLFVCLFYSFNFYAQSEINDYVSLNEKLQVLGQNGEVSQENLEGSPYLDENFTRGIINLGNKRIESMYLRYNVLNDQIEIKSQPDDEKIFILPKSDSVSYSINNYTYVSEKTRTKDGRVLFGYLKKLLELPNIVFFEKSSSYISPAQKDQTSYSQDRPAKIHITPHYYLGLGDKPVVEVDIREKDFRRLLGDAPGMENFFKENKIKDLNDVITMLRFYDQQ